jgi:hypothetical protein
MMTAVNFYTACMKTEIHPGFVADMVEQAGRIIEGVGNGFTTWGLPAALGSVPKR